MYLLISLFVDSWWIKLKADLTYKYIILFHPGFNLMYKMYLFPKNQLNNYIKYNVIIFVNICIIFYLL